jgi:hypothetical protein
MQQNRKATTKKRCEILNLYTVSIKEGLEEDGTVEQVDMYTRTKGWRGKVH